MSKIDDESFEERLQRIKDEDFLDDDSLDDEFKSKEKESPYDDPLYDLESTELAAIIRNNQ